MSNVARLAFLAQDGGTVLSEFARDVAREAQPLALRAHLLSRRAKSEPVRGTAPAEVHAARPTDAAKRGAPERAHEEDEQRAREEDGRQAHEEDERSATDLAAAAQRTIETAHAKLGPVKDQDAATKALALGLDVLAEMTLHLRQESARLNEAEEKRLSDAEERRRNDSEEER